MPGITINSKLDTKPVISSIGEMNRYIQSLRGTVAKAGRDMDASVVGYAKAMSTNAKVSREVNAQVEELNATYQDLVQQVDRLANTKIDTKEYADLKKEIEGTEKQLRRLQEAQQRLKDLGKDVVPTKEYTAVNKSIDNTRKRLNGIEEEYDRQAVNAESASNNAINIRSRIAKEEKAVQDFQTKLAEAEKQAKAFMKSAYGIADGERKIGVQMSRVDANYSNMIANAQEQIVDSQQELERVQWTDPAAAREIKDEISRYREKIKVYQEARAAKLAELQAEDTRAKSTDDYKRYQEYTEYANAYKQSLDDARTRLESYRNELPQAESEENRYVEIMTKLEEQLDAAQSEYDKLIEQRKELEATGGNVVDTDAMRRNQYDIQKATENLQKLQQQKEAMESSGTATVMGDTTKEYGDALSKAADAEEKLHETIEKAQEDTKPIHLKEWEQMSTVTGTVANGFARLQNVASMAGYAIQHPLEALNRIVPIVASGIANLAGRVFNLAASFGKMALNSIVSGLQRMASSAINAAAGFARMAASSVVSFIQRLAVSARNAAVNLAHMAGAGVVNGLKTIGSLALKAGSALLGMGKSAKRSNGSLKQSLTMIVRYTLGIRSLFMLVRRLRSAVVDAFKNMAQKVPEVNKTISALASSLDQVKNTLATAFQPILTAVAPYLVQLMDMLAGAMTRLGEFFAALTGQNYVYKATKAQIDYAKSLDKTKKKAKETENQLAGFDHLNILKENKDNSDDDDKTPTSDFKKVPIESWIKDLADRIKAMFKSGDFFGIGKLLADKLEELINKIDFKKLGQKIAKGLNAVVDVVNGFFDNFDFIDLGEKLSEAFMNMIQDIHWYELGRAATQKIRALIELLWGFVSDIDWDLVGDSIGNFLQGAFDNIPWGLLGTLLGTSITGVFQSILTAAETFEWGKAGAKLDEGFSNLINSIDIDTIYAALRTTLIGILDLITPTLTDTETWGKISSDFATFMNNFFQDEELWNKVRLALIGGMATAIASLKTFVSKFQWGANGTKFHDQLNKLVDEFPDDLGQVLSDLLAGALLFMGNVFGDGEIFNNLGQKLATWLDGILSNEEMWTNLGTTINGLLISILSFGEGFLQQFIADGGPTKAADNIKKALGEIQWGEIASRTWELLKNALSASGSFVDALLNETIDPEKAGMSGEYLAKVTAFNQQSIGAKLGTRIQEAFESIPWEAIASDLWSAAQTAFAGTSDFVSALLGVTKEDIASADNNSAIAIAKKLGQVISDAVAKIPWGDFGSALSDGVVNLFNAIAAYFKEAREQGELQEAISSFFNNIDWLEVGKSIVLAAWEAFLAVGETLWQVIVDGMKKNREASESYYEQIFTETANSLIGAYYRGVNEKLMDNESTKEIYKTAMDGIVQGADLYGGGETEAERFYNGFIGTVLDENGKVKDEFKSLIEAIYGSVDNFQFGAGDIESFFLGFDDAISNVPTGEGSAFYALMNAVYSSIDTEARGKGATKSYVDGAVEGLKENKESLKTEFADAVGGAIKNVEENEIEQGSPSKRARRSGQYYMQGLQLGVQDEAANTENTMAAAMDGVVNTVDSKWGEAENKQNESLSSMSNTLSTTMSGMTNTSNQETENQAKPVYDKYGEIMLAVEECMRAAWDYMKQYSGNMVTTMQTDMNNIANNASYGMNNLERTISDSFNRIGSMNWAYIGQNICNGIAQGIYNGWSWLNNTVWNLANSLFQSAKNALGIASPSKVFRDQVGYMVGAGLAEGLDDSQREVLGSVTDMAKAMVDEMQNTDLTADVGVNDNTMLDSITGALSTFSIKIEDSFITLTERLQAIADKVTFVTPDIAAGTVLPYAIQGDLNVNTDNIAVALEKNNEELINIIIQLVNNQTSAIVSGLERYCTTNVNIDKKSLTDFVVEEINRRTRAMGASPLLI